MRTSASARFAETITKLKPASGFANWLHLGLVALLPILVYVLVRINIIESALAIILLSKWRMFAVRPRYWVTNIRANGVDLIVGLASLVFMIHTSSDLWQLVWAAVYGAWLIGLKPNSSVLAVSAQAFVGQLFGMMALFMEWPSAPSWALAAGSGLIAYISARHFFDSFEEKYSRLLASIWAYFAAALVWLLSQWLLFYGPIAQPTILLTVIGYGLASLYYLDHHDKLSRLLRRQFVFVMLAIVLVVLALSNWGNKII